MRFRDRLLILGSTLVLVPMAAIVVLYSLIMSSSLAEDAARIVATKLDLLENRIASSHEILSRAGIATNEFYVTTARRAIAESFASALGEGECYFILDSAGAILETSTDGRGHTLAPDDPLRSLLGSAGTGPGGRQPRESSLRSPVFPLPGSKSIVASLPFLPWDWTLVVASDESRALAPLNRAVRLSLALSFILLGFMGAAIFLVTGRMSEPLAKLAALTSQLGEGRRGLSLDIGGRDEIGLLASRFNEMARKLDALTEGLETRVEERTVELTEANRRLNEVNASLAATIERVESMQGQLVESEKLVALGQLVAGIAHELNTPLGAISMAAQSLREILSDLPGHIDQLSAIGEESRGALLTRLIGNNLTVPEHNDRTERLKLENSMTAELRARGAADGGETASLLYEAGWRQEPLPAALAGSAAKDLAWSLYEDSGLGRSADVIATASSQAVRVIDALRTYARQDGKRELAEVRLETSIERVLTLFASKIKLGIEVSKSYHAVPPVLASEEKLAQVWTNLIANALQAMEYHGRLAISLSSSGGFALVSIKDSGPGIPDEVKDSIFTPFFTTKPAGEGTGLGLEISRRIVEDFGGAIDFESRPGETTFRVRLPLIAKP